MEVSRILQVEMIFFNMLRNTKSENNLLCEIDSDKYEGFGMKND